jgi:tripeptide aminopeptidase
VFNFKKPSLAMDIEQQRLLRIFYDLVKIDAVSKQEKPVADYIGKFIHQHGYVSTIDKAGKLTGGNTGNVIVRAATADQKAELALVAHMDTIKPTAGVLPQIKDGQVVSDGTTILGADNRAGIAIILYTLEILKKNNSNHIPFEVIFTIGEETGFYGSANLDLSKLTARTAYIFDASADPGNYIYSAPGACGFKITFTGKASHAAVQPEQGINALQMAAEFVQSLSLGQVDKQTTINIGRLVSGEANNVVPPDANLTGEIRSFSQELIQKYYQEIMRNSCEIAKKYGGKYTINPYNEFPGFTLDLSTPVVVFLEKRMKNLGIKPKALRYHGGSDANILNNRGFSAVNLGIGAKNPHANNEYIRLDSLTTMSRLCLSLVTHSTDDSRL